MLQSYGVLRTAFGRPQRYICWRCQRKQAISTTFLKRQDEAKKQWETWAKEIRSGTRQSLLAILEERGFVHAIAGDRNALNNLMIDKRIGAYVGIDPTASSLHVGHLLPLMALFWLHINGCHTVSLVCSLPWNLSPGQS